MGRIQTFTNGWQSHIDVNAGKIIEGVNTVEEVGKEIYKKIVKTANGWKTASERNNHQEFAIWRLAETM
ncbi:UxaA family hydrolase [Metabacillus sediminilitoris]|uniref:UxaA family hydrolase n=1 Tax=Metabacillus sediminilitoris TaxID=2567941 RepID=UPI001F2BFD75|nr:UxaA family hydrolase [Metabacillus sediminilitoris]